MSERTLTYQPELDGVRAVAVTMVLLFHHGFTWMSGGYVGVSVFFTLSGYLITSLLVVEHRRSGTISLPRFYVRRARRLLPAGLLCLGLIVVARAAGEFDGVDNLRRDLLGSLLQVQNWVKLLGASSYTELLDARTGQQGPLEHYWSLAIEEQFYWLWPLAILGGFALLRSARSRRIAVTVLAVVAAVAAPVIAAVWGADAAYWATPARAGEILLGAALAMWMRARDAPVASAWYRGWIAAPALVVIVAAGVTWPAGSGPAYSGLLPVFALASVALIWSLSAPSLVRRGLSAGPLVLLGRISYGVYLYHWPVFVLLDEDRAGVAGRVLFLVRVAVTLGIAAASYVLVERPLRRPRVDGARSFRMQGLLAGAAAAGIAVVAIVIVPGSAPDFYEPDAARADAVALEPVASLAPLRPVPSTTGVATSTSTTPVAVPSSDRPVPAPTSTASATTTAPTTTALVTPSRPVRILVVGDSTALATGGGLIEWAALHPELAQVSLATSVGCGFLRDGVVAEGDPFQRSCDELLDVRLGESLASLQPDVVVLMVTMRDLENRTWSAEEGLLTPLDPRYADRLLAAEREIAQRLEQLGAPRIAWVLPPRPVAPFQPGEQHMADPARYEVQERAIRTVADEHRETVRVIDLAAWMEARDLVVDGVVRPDGIHFAPEAALEISEAFLGPAIVSAALG